MADVKVIPEFAFAGWRRRESDLKHPRFRWSDLRLTAFLIILLAGGGALRAGGVLGSPRGMGAEMALSETGRPPADGLATAWRGKPSWPAPFTAGWFFSSKRDGRPRFSSARRRN